jgi:hypothetical protein
MDILDVLGDGARRVNELNDSVALRLAALSFLDVYSDFSGWSVYPASPQAERVLGAAMMLDPELRAQGAGPTVVMDVNIASGTLISNAASRIRESGNEAQLVGVALHSLVSGWVGATDLAHLSRLIVVHPHVADRTERTTVEATAPRLQSLRPVDAM